MKVSRKYIAGFLDSDGTVGLQFSKCTKGFTTQVRVAIKQRKDRADVLKTLCHEWQVKLYEDENSYLFALVGPKAVRFIEQIKNHLVIKREVSEWCLTQAGTICIEPDLLRDELAKLRIKDCIYKKPFPSRAWLAGYFDGNGCVEIQRSNGRFYPRVSIKSWVPYRAGIDLIENFFGGSTSIEKVCLGYYLSRPEKFLEYIVNHSIIKKNQIEFLLGNIRSDGLNEQTKLTLSNMKTPASTKRDQTDSTPLNYSQTT